MLAHHSFLRRLMSKPRSFLAALTLACLAAQPLGAWADSSSVSSALDSGSRSVGSVSDSIQGSSNSSTGQRVAAGEYRVVEIAAADDRPGLERLQLEGEGGRFTLLLPAAVRESVALRSGDRIAVSTPAYGLAFALAGAGEPFFLALNEGWRHEFQRRAVTL
ncbi:hypothetical protein H5407_16030 [Mitsuaria sp. WAJ17]|uniref:hypothetical protein n=1 Tax=Mitsuaria sp. WAJ17 TaxID=2761452 RepID=UPI001601810F|nr:hypothetical protein [Mitsuaria sp. WAJ17]MBB2486735.1 hypothetical protein [Mitsuaria sp. WAJ17]